MSLFSRAPTEEFNLIAPEGVAGPETITHPLSGETVGSWFYLVDHVVKKPHLLWPDTVKLIERFDFAARKIVTIDPKACTISQVQDFDGDGREDDVKHAAEWLEKTHPKWYYKSKPSEGEIRLV